MHGSNLVGVAEVILHSASLYQELGIAPDEPYTLAVNHSGLEGREFWVSTPRRSVERGRICHSAAARWTRDVTQDYVESNLKTLTGDVTKDLFVLFDFAEMAPQTVDSLVDEFLGRRL